MRKFLIAVFFALSLGGCASLNVNPPDVQLVTVADRLNASINQGYAVHGSIALTLSADYKAGLITKEEKTAYAKRTRQALDYLDQADELLGNGLTDAASAQAALANSILNAVQAELAKRAAKEKA